MPPLTTSPNPLLDRPSSIVLVEAYLKASLPWTLPGDDVDGGFGAEPSGFGGGPFGDAFSAVGDDPSVEAEIDAPPVRWSTRDVATPRGMFIRRIIQTPAFAIGEDFGAVEQLVFQLWNGDGALNGWLNGTTEVKGKTLDAFLYDWLTGTVAPSDPIFRGMILGATAGTSPRIVDVTCVPEDA